MMRSIFPRQCWLARNTNPTTKACRRDKHQYLSVGIALFIILLVPLNQAKAQSPDTLVNVWKPSNGNLKVCESSDFIEFGSMNKADKLTLKSKICSSFNSCKISTRQFMCRDLSDNNDHSMIYFAFANNKEPNPSVRNQESRFTGLGRETDKSEKTSVGLINDRKYMPRFDLHDAYTIYPNQVLLDIRFRGANSSGRRLINTQRSITINITQPLDVWFSENNITFLGRNRSNRFDVRADHWGFKYNWDPQSVNNYKFALVGEYVHAGTATVVTTDSLSRLRSPTTFIFSAVGNKSFGEVKTGTLSAVFSRSTLLDLNGGNTLGLLAGVEWDLNNQLMVRGGTGLFWDSPSKGWSPVFAGSLSYILTIGLHVEIGGMFAPRGLPLSGTSLTGASALLLHFPGDGIVRDFSTNTFGAYMLRIVYGVRF